MTTQNTEDMIKCCPIDNTFKIIGKKFSIHIIRNMAMHGQTRKMVAEIGKTDMSSILPNYKINNVVGRYHSGLEHTFLWILDAEDPHLIQKLAIDSGMASFNEVKIVPLMTFEDVVGEIGKMDQE